MTIEDTGRRFKDFKALTAGVDGYFTDIAASVSDCLLSFQREEGISGHALEIGAWHGVSSCMWAMHLRPKETLQIIDLAIRPELVDLVEKYRAKSEGEIKLVKGSSFGILSEKFIIDFGRLLRVAHIDGDHSAWGIATDLRRCARLLNVYGVIIVDDFLNDRFPQITEVVYNFLRENSNEYQLVAICGNKGFLVSEKAYSKYNEYIRLNILRHIESCGLGAKPYDGTFNGRPVITIRRA